MPAQPKSAPRRKFQRISKGRDSSIRREELNRLIDLLNERDEVLNRVLQDQQIQFHRIAQIQADLDLLKGARSRAKR